MTDTNELYIQNQLARFNITDAAISELQERYKTLTIKDVNDTEGYKEVRAARIVIKSHRVDVDKRRKELTEEAVKYQRAVNNEAKRITELLVPIEKQLSEIEDAYIAEKEAIKAKKEEEEALTLQTRINMLIQFEYHLKGNTYSCEYSDVTISIVMLKSMPNVTFDEFVKVISSAYQKMIEARIMEAEREKQRIAQEEAQKKAEQERLEQQRLAQEAENNRLAEIARQQAEMAAQLKAEHDRLEALKLENERLEAQRVENARLEAERLERERLEAIRLEKERAEALKLEAERVEAQRIINERLEAERIEHERLEAIRLENEKVEAARLEAERKSTVYREIQINRRTIYEYIADAYNERFGGNDIAEETVDKILEVIERSIDDAVSQLISDAIHDVTEDDQSCPTN